MPLSPFRLKNRSNVLFIKRASYNPTGQYSSVGSIDANFVTQFRIRLSSSAPLVSTILKLMSKQLRIYIIRYNINYIEERVLIYLGQKTQNTSKCLQKQSILYWLSKLIRDSLCRQKSRAGLLIAIY